MTLTDVTGAPAAELSLVPPVFVSRTLSALRAARPLTVDERAAALVKAGELFEQATLNGQSPQEYDHTVSRVAGMPISVVRTARGNVAHRVARAHLSVQQARPQGALCDWRDPLTRKGSALWTRRGEVFAVQSAGNHPGTHSLWPEALALGYRVVVRPSRREPFTPHRLITALRAAGFADDHVVLLPTDHDGVDALMGGTDLGMVYGGADVVARYQDDPAVLPQGPGRTKILVTGGGWREHLPVITDSIAGHGGTGCVNATAVLAEHDPATVAEAIADRLAQLPFLPPQDERAVLPVLPLEAATQVAKHLSDRAAGARSLLGEVVHDLGDGSAVLGPAVHLLDRVDERAGVELPFPSVWVAPWQPADGVTPLRDSLVLTAFTEDEHLVDALLAEPGIANLHLGRHPTHRIAPGLPHDDYLAGFLMRAKAFIR
jgi:acyl-CoA reductase-like NAD-dependent aldehyde dehydrogenase